MIRLKGATQSYESHKLVPRNEIAKKKVLPSVSVSPSSTLRFKDLVPVLYQEGRHQGDPVTLGVGGFGRVVLVSVFLCVHCFDISWNGKCITLALLHKSHSGCCHFFEIEFS